MKSFRLFALIALAFFEVLFPCIGECAGEQRNLSVERTELLPAQKRTALVIGNGAYSNAPLKNPVNDARDMATKLRFLGFDVIERINLTVKQIGSTLREFRSKVVPGSVALVFYAGHGLQIGGDNYLLMVDAEIDGEEDVHNQSLGVKQILDILEQTKSRLNLVFLDACRNNPYARRFRSASDGLGRVTAPSGTLISFATRPGSVASDGDGRNGLYTQYLLSAMEIPNQPVEQVLKRVVSGVRAASKGRQEPWMEGSIEGDFYFLTADQPVVVPVDITKLRQEATEQAAKERVELQKVLKAQQEATDRAVQEALLRANEQAARDRAEMQASMEKTLKEALAKQNELLESERAARLAATPDPERAPVQSASLPPPRPVANPSRMRSGNGPTFGDEWEYVVTDHIFGKKRSLIEVVAAAGDGKGVMEKFVLNGKDVGQWVFDGTPVLIATSGDIGLLFASHWKGGDLREIPIVNWGMCKIGSCEARGKVVGQESVTVPAGTFNTTRIEIYINVRTNVGGTATVVVWYSDLHQRIVKQRGTSDMTNGTLSTYRFNETIELSAIRYAVR